jgi:hypothetical protein
MPIFSEKLNVVFKKKVLHCSGMACTSINCTHHLVIAWRGARERLVEIFTMYYRD